MVNDRVVCDSGPLIHLAEVDANNTWKVFPLIHVPDVVRQEVTKFPFPGPELLKDERFEIVTSSDIILKLAQQFIIRYKMGGNDAIVLAHAVSHHASLLLTDDLELRELSKREGISPVGSVGILLRAFREGIYDRKPLFERLDRLILDSSLYITMDLIEFVKRAAIEFEIHKRKA